MTDLTIELAKRSRFSRTQWQLAMAELDVAVSFEFLEELADVAHAIRSTPRWVVLEWQAMWRAAEVFARTT